VLFTKGTANSPTPASNSTSPASSSLQGDGGTTDSPPPAQRVLKGPPILTDLPPVGRSKSASEEEEEEEEAKTNVGQQGAVRSFVPGQPRMPRSHSFSTQSTSSREMSPAMSPTEMGWVAENTHAEYDMERMSGPARARDVRSPGTGLYRNDPQHGLSGSPAMSAPGSVSNRSSPLPGRPSRAIITRPGDATRRSIPDRMITF